MNAKMYIRSGELFGDWFSPALDYFLARLGLGTALGLGA